MDIGLDPVQRDLAITLLSAMAVFSAIVFATWPYLLPDTLDSRMRKIADERERIRERERARLKAGDSISLLRPRPRKLFSFIVERLRLDEQGANRRIPRMLANAGFRGNSAVITYLAAQILMPVVMFALALLYVFVILRLQQPTMIKLLIAVAVGALGYFLPTLYVKNRIAKRQKSIQRAWPDALDLLVICVESGAGIEPALQKVAQEIGTNSIDLAEEIGLTAAELSFLPERRQAFENLAERTGLDSVKAVVAILKQAEKHGTSLGRSLRVLAQENRDMRLRLAEKKAAALPPKLTVPMILFFLPVLFAVIITPAAIQVAATH